MSDQEYMREALLEAHKAEKIGEVPVGAVIVHNGVIIARGHNLRETERTVLGHAEIIAIKSACDLLGWRLDECDIYVTIEPCPMCSGAIIQSRFKRLIYGAKDYKTGCAGSVVDLFAIPFNHQVEVTSGVLADECGKIMSEFFRKLR